MQTTNRHADDSTESSEPDVSAGWQAEYRAQGVSTTFQAPVSASSGHTCDGTMRPAARSDLLECTVCGRTVPVGGVSDE